MRRIPKYVNKKEITKKADTPIVIYVSIVVMALLSYMVARIVLDGRPHPYHWAALIVGGVVGYFVGWLWFRWRGDIF